MRAEIKRDGKVSIITVFEYNAEDYSLLASLVESVFPSIFTTIYQTISEDKNSYIIYGFKNMSLCADLEKLNLDAWKYNIEIKETK